MPTISLGTIALEPNRWFGVTQDRWGTIVLADWLDRIAEAGFDGIELWESHLRDANDTQADAIIDHPLPITVFNTYVGFADDPDDDRTDAAEWIRRTGAGKVKWNTGPARDDDALAAYGERLARWSAQLPDVHLTCECHDGSAMDDPDTAARVLAAGGPPHRSQAIVHSNDGHDRLRSKFAAYGERITHVHVNHLDRGCPPLADIRDELGTTVSLLHELGFDGTWTIEFVHGTGTDKDRPDLLLAQASADLEVLRRLLD
jgi:sugar phosphate isomerase/epimerase